MQNCHLNLNRGEILADTDACSFIYTITVHEH